MADVPDGQALIHAFFAALELRRLDQCEAVLGQLRSVSQTQPTYEPWSAYFTGILANERDHDWAEAERIFNRLLSAELDPPLHGRIVLALGLTYEYQGRWAEAIHAYEQSLPIFAALDQSVDQAKVWKQIAISYRRGFTQGDFGPEALEHAIQYCQLALDVLEPLTNPSPDVAWLEGSVWNTLGAIHMSLGQWDEAIACYQQDLAICRSLDDRFGMGLSYHNLGEIYQKRGRESWPQALVAYRQALAIIREFRDRYEELDVLANLAFLHQEMGEYKPALDYYGQAIQIIESLRAGVSSEAARSGFFATTSDTYANAVLLCLATGRTAQAFDYVERARARAFLDVLATGSSVLARAFEAPTITLPDVQAALPEDALLLEYFTTGLLEVPQRHPALPHAQRHRFPPATTLIFAVTRQTALVFDARISPNDLRPSHLSNVVERHFLHPAIRRRLFDYLIAPVAPLLLDRRLLYLVPHGPLHYIPFQALVAPDGNTLLREQGPRLVCAPSATVLFRYSRPAPERALRPCLALGYNGDRAERMRFAEEEARTVARLTGGDLLAGPAPKKTLLFEQAAHYRLLHLSCHGSFDPLSPLASALHLAEDEQLTALDILTHLRLGCDLVTLSACESGLSRVRRGDELDGFVRAFLSAGAKALLCTLWRVDERSTHLLMQRFYQELQAGSDFAQALKRAQLYLMRLSSEDAQRLLRRALGDQESGMPLSEQTSDQSAPVWPAQGAGRPLQGLAGNDSNPESELAVGEREDEPLFADPYYWAPFILIGTTTPADRTGG